MLRIRSLGPRECNVLQVHTASQNLKVVVCVYQVDLPGTCCTVLSFGVLADTGTETQREGPDYSLTKFQKYRVHLIVALDKSLLSLIYKIAKGFLRG